MKPKPRVRPDRAAKPAKAGEARSVEGYRLVTPRYSSGGGCVFRATARRYVVVQVCRCESDRAARNLARILNREDRLRAEEPALLAARDTWRRRAAVLSVAITDLLKALDLEEIRPYAGGKLYFAMREARRLVGLCKEEETDA